MPCEEHVCDRYGPVRTLSENGLKSNTTSRIHPFAPLTPEEIRTAVKILRSAYPEETRFQYKAITLLEPPKDAYLAWEAFPESSSKPIRKAYIPYYIRQTSKYFEAVINLSESILESNIRVGPGFHGSADGAEIINVENVALADERVKEEIKKLQLPEGVKVVSDPWIFGADGTVADDKRQYRCFLYALPESPAGSDGNHYAHPLSISPVVDVETMRVTDISYLPTGSGWEVTDKVKPHKMAPPNDYVQECLKVRDDLKPLHVSQPEGASYTIREEDGIYVGKWQKWKFYVGFNHREGMVLYNVSYEGRSLFYRLSLSDMTIPYGDPRPPYHRKQAFDLGDAGAGVMANDLKLGCDCLGLIQYLSSWIADDNGEPEQKQNCICVHEQDSGIGWKHTNYRTGRAVVVRNRELVLQSIVTVSNYEYILAFIFNQAGELTYEVRATGILSTAPIDEGAECPSWGTIVHPGVLAAHHQHIFSLRVDPMLDGRANRLVYEEVERLPREENPFGTGYITKEYPIEKSTGIDTDVEKHRVFKIQNSAVGNPVNGKAVGYKIDVPPFQKIVADENSMHYKRAEFGDKAIYVTTYKDGELYAGGQHTNQSHGGHGLRSWISREDDVLDKDIVVWISFGLNHIPRIEDFPVMPVEILRVSLKPVNFFTKSPSIDVPPSDQTFNKSALNAEGHRQGFLEAVVQEDGKPVLEYDKRSA